jgi:hypothetical protein
MNRLGAIFLRLHPLRNPEFRTRENESRTRLNGGGGNSMRTVSAAPPKRTDSPAMAVAPHQAIEARGVCMRGEWPDAFKASGF